MSVGLKNTSTDTITSDAPIDFRSRMRISYLLLPNARQRTYSRRLSADHNRQWLVHRSMPYQGVRAHCPAQIELRA